MWVTYSLLLTLVLVTFIDDSVSKPQALGGEGGVAIDHAKAGGGVGEVVVNQSQGGGEGGIVLPADDNEFINLLDPEAGQKSPTCRCIPFKSCCDNGDTSTVDNDGDTSPFDERHNNLDRNNQIVDMEQHKNGKCDEILHICCDNECHSNAPPIAKALSSPNQCGIRNTNGLDLTVNNFDDRQAQLSEFPWMVALLDKNGTYVAGGSLIHRRVVLTGGHKVYNLEANNLVARMGDWDLNSTSEPIPHQEVNVAKIVFHEEFQRPTMENNIALLILDSDVSLSDRVMPICMPESDETFEGWQCIVTGWGKDMFGKTGRYQTIMKKLTVPVVKHSQCEEDLRKTRLGPTFELHDSFNCAGGHEEDACTGDGGSPLVCPNPENPNVYVQMGVVSWGIGCGIVGNPGVYASIPKSVEWIKRTIQTETTVGFDERRPN